MEAYVIRQQKKLRRGFTTGTCAAAAAKAAAYELCTGLKIRRVTVLLPSGERPDLSVFHVEKKDSFEKESAEYYCVKDAGDDPDVTDRAKIHVCVRRISGEEIPDHSFTDPEFPGLVLNGGEGVGTVTKPGLEQDIGQAAINKVPRHMIFQAVEEALSRESEDREENRSQFEMQNEAKCIERKSFFLITVSVTDGRKIAQKTFNPKLGIEGGISILGTSGIVEPMSEAALVATIELEIRQTVSQGQKNLIFVPGNYGERYVRDQLGMKEVRTIQCSNYVGEAIDLAAACEAESILFVGNFGKLVKLGAGIMNTHSRYADGRWEIMAAHAALQGEQPCVLQRIREAVTTDQMLTVLQTKERRKAVTDSIIKAIDYHLKRRAGNIPIGAVIYSEQYGLLGQTQDAGRILDLHQ